MSIAEVDITKTTKTPHSPYKRITRIAHGVISRGRIPHFEYRNPQLISFIELNREPQSTEVTLWELHVVSFLPASVQLGVEGTEG